VKDKSVIVVRPEAIILDDIGEGMFNGIVEKAIFYGTNIEYVLKVQAVKLIMKYKLILSDVDGTLVDENQNISENVLAKINQYQKEGGIFAIASGRIEESEKSTVNSLI